MRFVGAGAWVAQLALAFVLYRLFTGEPGPDMIDPFRWGGAAICASFVLGFVAAIGGSWAF